MGKVKALMVGTLPTDLLSVKGGVESAILNLFAGFTSLSGDIEIVHVSFLEGISDRIELEYSPNVKIIFLPFKVKIKLLDYLINKSSLSNIVAEENPDVIHIQESEPHLLRFISFSKNTIVVTQHGIMKEELKYATGVKNKLKFVFKTMVERFIFPSFKNVIFISEYNRKLYTGKLNQSAYIGNAVNPIFFEKSDIEPTERNSIIYVGVISKRKNLKMVIEALHQLKLLNIQFYLHVVGWYKEKDVQYEIEIAELIQKYDLSSQIKFYGWLKQQEIVAVFRKCNFFILPSLQETLPVSIAEAMALGKIVIASDVGAISEMFENKVSGFLFEKNNLENLVSLLKEIHDNTEMDFSEWSDRIRKVARLKYYPMENARKTLDFYKKVLSTGSAK
jgi:glycosyltransferase involved in cell wall biosynthesis